MVDGPTDDLKSSPMGGTRRNDFGARLYRFYEWLTVPFAIYVLLSSDKIQPEYGMTRWKRMRLGWRFQFHLLLPGCGERGRALVEPDRAGFIRAAEERGLA